MSTVTLDTEAPDLVAYAMSATYSPDDDKLRLYSLTRLDDDTYARVRAAGFRRAPKQDLFVAPAWTPEREDLLVELAGEIGDEDTSLVERAEARAERFDGYQANRLHDAEAARAAVAAIADHIPLGQPILVGHHSERHARRDAERIRSGMQRAVKMWDTAQYWRARAAGAIAHAQYKERPAVRHRRIKGLEADRRRCVASYTPDPRTRPQTWDGKVMVWVGPRGGRGGSWVDEARLPAIREYAERWIAHLDLRLLYERAMLDEDGGIAADRWTIEKGGRVLVRDEWLPVVRVNRSAGAICSVTHVAPRTVRWQPIWTTGIEEVRDYRPPTADDAATIARAMKKPPLCNYPGTGFVTMTKTEWERIYRDFKGSHTIEATATAGTHRVRSRIMGFAGRECVFVSDLPRKDPPRPAPPQAAEPPARDDDPAPIDHLDTGEAQPRLPEAGAVRDVERPTPEVAPASFALTAPVARVASQQRELFEGMRAQLRAGVQIVSAPQLFPTPVELAARMVALAQLARGQRVLEPSAGTGRLIDAMLSAQEWSGTVVAVEMNAALASQLRDTHRSDSVTVQCRDFLACTPADLGLFDVVLMNPPFAKAQDIAHVQHALRFLKPGGRLVALCANGPRQQTALRPYVEQSGGTWEELPADTFAASGTSVRAVLICLESTML